MVPYHPVDDWSYTENGNIVTVTIDFPGMMPLYDRFLEAIQADFEGLPR